MRMYLRLILTLACAALLLAAPVMADVPENMTIQGRLTDAAGDPLPAGLKIFTFKIFDAEVGGAEVWPGGPGEDQTLSTDADGLWTARVGKMLGLTDAVFQDTTRWLEVTVDDGVNPAETLPRVKLNTNPFTYRSASSQQADDADLLDGLNSTDFAADVHSHAPADITPQGAGSTLDADLLDGNEAAAFAVVAHNHDPDYVNVTGDVMTGNLGWNSAGLRLNADVAGSEFETYRSTGTLNSLLGGATASSFLKLYGSNILRFDLIGGDNWAQQRMYDTDGDVTVDLQAQTTLGGRILLYQEDATLGMNLFGGSTSNGATLSMYSAGGSNTIALDADLTGNSAVVVPSGSISDFEIQDEPGLSNSVVGGMNASVPGDYVIDSVIINCPTPGYVIVTGRIGWINTTHTIGTTDELWLTVEKDKVPSIVDGIDVYRVPSAHPSSGGNYAVAMNSSRVFVESAGSQKYYLLYRFLSGLGAKHPTRPSIRALFVPTLYGTSSFAESPQGGVDDGSANTETLESIAPQSIKTITLEDHNAELEAELAEMKARLAKLEAEDSNLTSATGEDQGVQ